MSARGIRQPMSRALISVLLTLLLLVVGCVGGGGGNQQASEETVGVDGDYTGNATGKDAVRIPLTDMGDHAYLGFSGGLYSNGSNTPPADHAAVGAARAKNIRPLDANGNADSNGKVVLLSIGMSNTSGEFCGRNITTDCWPETFMAQAAQDPSVNSSSLVIVNGAQGGRDAETGHQPSDRYYDVIRDTRLSEFGVAEKQVQIVWLKQADARPTVSLPDSSADAYRLQSNLAEIVRALKVRYPNLQQLLLSSRTYGGYATTKLNPEPYAYESGFAVKWLIQAQIEQMANGGRIVDTQDGDLNYDTMVAPWIAWGPYLWADGQTPRSDRLAWERADFGRDGTHLAEPGRSKVGALLLDFFKTSPATSCWFLAGQTCS